MLKYRTIADSPEERANYARTYLAGRQRARTDLLFLVNEVLAPPHSKIVTRAAHGTYIDHCQQFKGWLERMEPNSRKIVFGEPLLKIDELEGSRDNLLLGFRGSLKTSIHTVAHAVQWIINYPDIRIAIGTASAEQNERVITEIKGHFASNPRFRFWFPEFCPPPKKAADWGSKSEFTVPARRRQFKEPTVMGLSLGKHAASIHFDLMLFTDVVTEANTHTKGQIEETKEWFGQIEPLRERYLSKDGSPNPGRKFVEGTIYDFGDYHQMVVDHQKNLSPEQRTWKIMIQPCWKDKAKRIPAWPERFPAAELDRILNSPEVGPYIFACQYELFPIPDGTGLAAREQIKFFPANIAKQLQPRYRIATTIDLADITGTVVGGDNTAMVTAGFDSDGRCDVLQIQHGHFTDEQVVDRMFLIQTLYPTNAEFRIQKDQISGGMRTLLRREMEKRRLRGDANWYLNVKYVAIPTNESKNHKIIRNLQGWFSLGLLRFSDAIDCKATLIDEILRFPKAPHDDILDALADQFHNAEGQPVDAAIPRQKSEVERQSFGHSDSHIYGPTLWTPEESDLHVDSRTGL